MGLATVAGRGRYKPFWHVSLINEYLVKVDQGKIDRLMVFMPPRHGKSELISRYFTSWFLIRNPRKRVILTSYEAGYAATWGRKSRDVVEEFGEALNGIKVRSESSAANRWDIEGDEGGMATAGAGGPITGRGAHLLVIDDPVKNAEEANSEVYREKIWDWWQSTAVTRLEPGGAVVIIMTRWHTGDLAGKLLETEPDSWTVLNLPAIAEQDENYCGGTYTRKKGQALCPERYPLDALKKIQVSSGSYWFESMFQGHPVSTEGGIFKRNWIRRYKWEKEGESIILADGRRVDLMHCYRFQTVDPAASLRDEADYFVIATWALHGPELILLDLDRDHYDGPEQVRRMKQAHEDWKSAAEYVEGIAYQLTLIQHARKQGIPVLEIDKEDLNKDKISRFLSATPHMEAGHFWLPEWAPWLGVYENELFSIPKGEHDDCGDITAYGCVIAMKYGNQLIEADEEKQEKRTRDRGYNVEEQEVPQDPMDGFRTRG